MSPFRRLLSCTLGLAFVVLGAYMLYSLLFLGSGGYIWMYASSGIGVFVGCYLIWTDGIAPMLGKPPH